jgi:acylphosphatase
LIDEEAMADKAFYARVTGKVQGVGFRYSATMEARRLRLSGWVRNATNGDVEVWAEGAEDKLKTFLAWLKRGPEYSRVDAVEKEENAPQGFEGFGVDR